MADNPRGRVQYAQSRVWCLVIGLVALAGLGAATIVPVTGVHTGKDPATGQYPPRLRIQDLHTSGPQWDLYIQAMVALQSIPEDDELSYFALSGIHGRPYVAWNGVDQLAGAPLTGYCTHNEMLFAIWHRPLVAVFEQTLARHVQAVAASYTGDRAAVYRRAADTWRHPYWDWAADPVLPEAVVQPTVTIGLASNGSANATVDNPLRRYRFHPAPPSPTLFPPGDDDDGGRLSSYPETLRCPDPATNTSMPALADGNLAGIDLASQVYRVYARVADWARMSSTASDSGSFEQQHNEVHVAAGCVHPAMGHFAHLGYSGFDPVFMMHHAAIDRHVALWQAIHPDAFWRPGEADARKNISGDDYPSTGQFATAPGTPLTAESPLKPFFASADADNRAFHTSRSARDIAVFGYTYPELLAAEGIVGNRNTTDNTTAQAAALSRAITATVNRLYGPKAATSKRAISHTSTAYFVRIGIEKEGLPLPAAVNIYLGAAGTLVGRLLVLKTHPSVGRVHGEVSLQQALENEGRQDGASAEDVVRRTFRWEVKALSSETIRLPGGHDISVEVREEQVNTPNGIDTFPVYSHVRILKGLGTE